MIGVLVLALAGWLACAVLAIALTVATLRRDARRDRWRRRLRTPTPPAVEVRPTRRPE